MRAFLMLVTLVVGMTAGVARAQGPANLKLTPPFQSTFAVNLFVGPVLALNGGLSVGGVKGICGEKEWQKASLEFCLALTIDTIVLELHEEVPDHHDEPEPKLTYTGEFSVAVFRKWSRVSLGLGTVFMSEYAPEGLYLGPAATVNLYIPIRDWVGVSADVGAAIQFKVAPGSNPLYNKPPEIGSWRPAAFGMLALVFRLGHWTKGQQFVKTPSAL